MILLLVLMLVSFSFADKLLDEYNNNCRPVSDDFYSDAYRGWFYKEYCENLKKKIEERQKESQIKPKPKKEVPKTDIPKDYSKVTNPDEKVKIIKENLENVDFWQKTKYPWQWLKDDNVLKRIEQKMFKEVVDKAVYYSSLDYTDEEKIGTAVYLVDYSRRNSFNFAKGYTSYILANQQYNIADRVGRGSWSYRSVSSTKDDKVRNYILQRINNIGLIFFGSANCPYCREQVNALRYLRDRLPNIYIRVVVSDASECSYYLSTGVVSDCSSSPLSFQRFNVEILPTIFIYYNKNNQRYLDVLSAGLTDAQSLMYGIMSFVYKIDTGMEFNYAEFY